MIHLGSQDDEGTYKVLNFGPLARPDFVGKCRDVDHNLTALLCKFDTNMSLTFTFVCISVISSDPIHTF